MTSKTVGGSTCAVATCVLNYSKAKRDGLQISFHRFPKDSKIQKIWIQKCKRKDKFNPATSFICSEHFCAEDFFRDMKAELIGYTPRFRTLKSEAVPTLNLPMNKNNAQNASISKSSINRQSRMEAKFAKQFYISGNLKTDLKIMAWCVVIGCKNNLKATKREGKLVSYHIFPKNPLRRDAWLNALNRPFRFNPDSSYVCSEHFLVDDFECNSLKEQLLNIKVKKQLKKTAVPSVNITTSLKNEPVDVLNYQCSDLVNCVIDDPVNFDDKCCAVFACSNTAYDICDVSQSGNNIVFHNFPSDDKLSEKWLEFCNRPKEFLFEYGNARICSQHFDEEDYVHVFTPESVHPVRTELKNDAIPKLSGGIRITKVESLENDPVQSVRMERKRLVEKLLADYEEEQKTNGHLNSMVTKYPTFFSSNINPNAKLGDKLKLLKAKTDSESYFSPKKRKLSPPSKPSKPNSEGIKSADNNLSQKNKDQIIQVSAVQGGLMLHAVSLSERILFSPGTEKNVTEEEEEIIIVTEDEANKVDLSTYNDQPKESSTEVIVVTDLKEADDTLKNVDILPKKCSISNKNSNISNSKYSVPNRSQVNESRPTPLFTAKVSLSEEKGCQVLIPCEGCEHKSLKVNKLLRERTRILRDLNQSSEWKDPDEINTLKRMNGVLSMLLMQCINDKNSKKSSSVRVDIMQNTIERIDRGWTMQDTSETLCQAFSANAYDEFAKKFPIINEI